MGRNNTHVVACISNIDLAAVSALEETSKGQEEEGRPAGCVATSHLEPMPSRLTLFCASVNRILFWLQACFRSMNSQHHPQVWARRDSVLGPCFTGLLVPILWLLGPLGSDLGTKEVWPAVKCSCLSLTLLQSQGNILHISCLIFLERKATVS